MGERTVKRRRRFGRLVRPPAYQVFARWLEALEQAHRRIVEGHLL